MEFYSFFARTFLAKPTRLQKNVNDCFTIGRIDLVCLFFDEVCPQELVKSVDDRSIVVIKNL